MDPLSAAQRSGVGSVDRPGVSIAYSLVEHKEWGEAGRGRFPFLIALGRDFESVISAAASVPRTHSVPVGVLPSRA